MPEVPTRMPGGNVPTDPLKAQGYRTQRAELPEDLWQPLYDRVNYPAAGSSQLSFFSVSRGQSATLIRAGATGTFTKTYRDTNMENANVVPTKMFKFVGISLAYVHEDEGEAANPIDRDKIRSGGYLHFRIVDKDILYLPLVFIPEANPNTIAATTATATTIIGAAGGGGANVPMYKLPIPITLNPYENFTVTLDFDGTVTTTKAVDIYVCLQGFMRRPT
jgi:hypothetical protein